MKIIIIMLVSLLLSSCGDPTVELGGKHLVFPVAPTYSNYSSK